MTCPICESEQTNFHRKDGRELLICRACRHISWGEMPTPDELRTFYSDAYTEAHQQEQIQAEHASYYADHVRELAGMLSLSVSRLAIADVGCSYPTLLEQAVKQGCRLAVGVDWSKEAKAFGARVGVRVVTPEEFSTSVPDESLDVLRYSHTLEHTPDPVSVLTSQMTKLRPGGLLYITQPNFPIFKDEPSDIEPMDSVWPNHLQFFNPLSASILVRKANVGIKKFFSVSNEAAAEEKYRSIMDIDYANRHLFALAPLGEPTRGFLNSFPYYSGENSAIYAVK